MTANDLEEVGRLVFEFIQDPMIMNVTVFTTDQFAGEPRESEGISLFIIFVFCLIFYILNCIIFSL